MYTIIPTVLLLNSILVLMILLYLCFVLSEDLFFCLEGDPVWVINENVQAAGTWGDRRQSQQWEQKQ